MKMNKIKAKVIECYDSNSDTKYWCVVELYENGYVSPWCIGGIAFNLTKESLDSLVKEAMYDGYDEVLFDDKVKERMGM